MRDKRGKFVELANNRVSRAINDLRLIGNLSNRAAYEYSDDDVRKITRTLQRELELMKARFAGTKESRNADFSIEE
jgi:transcription elongation GreA/GreB family factor